ncbi:fumarylacetoacetate hydrolase family protein [Actinomadura soli]|uniref:Fumarylacetoacetate hydrolase family protein n=1 Tax=Actinomadura soli TaxID=2508997 RepID=A0A5C4JHR5_9ACTN|nr:fumarylacetoacetate hydrolase family protein [Actinomadura soli]TMR05705.1 fumarylacetoacetate hydrolase family protein [Actinomadura soli]
MRVANLAGRLVLLAEQGALDVATASGGRLPSDPQKAFDRWAELRAWAEVAEGDPIPVDDQRLGPPVPRPRQVFAIGLNYAGHAAESGVATPEFPSVFTKFPTSVGSPRGTIDLPSAHVDWEVELVAVVGRTARHVGDADGWSYVAGLTVGQDLSERRVQLRPPVPQFSLGKSFPGFGPIGPELVTPDEFDDPDTLAIGCEVNGESVQYGTTGDLVFSIPRLISCLSSVVTLLPGDLIFTGTPAGIGATREPPRYLRDGDELTSWIEGIGRMRHRFRASAPSGLAPAAGVPPR